MNPLRGLDIKGGSGFSTIIRPLRGQEVNCMSLTIEKHRRCFIIVEKNIPILNHDHRR